RETDRRRGGDAVEVRGEEDDHLPDGEAGGCGTQPVERDLHGEPDSTRPGRGPTVFPWPRGGSARPVGEKKPRARPGPGGGGVEGGRSVVAVVVLVAGFVVARPAQAGYLEDAGWGGLTVLSNVLYMPLKIVYATLGGVTGGLAYGLTLGDLNTAETVWVTS